MRTNLYRRKFWSSVRRPNFLKNFRERSTKVVQNIFRTTILVGTKWRSQLGWAMIPEPVQYDLVQRIRFRRKKSSKTILNICTERYVEYFPEIYSSVNTARSREDETRNGRRNANRNPRWWEFRSLFKWAFWKETCVDHRGFRFAFWWQFRVLSSQKRAVGPTDVDFLKELWWLYHGLNRIGCRDGFSFLLFSSLLIPMVTDHE